MLHSLRKLFSSVFFWSIVLIVTLSVATVTLVRVDTNVRKGATVLLLRLQHETGSELRLLRLLLGIRAEYSIAAAEAAIQSGGYEVLDLLLAAGFDPNSSSSANTPLLIEAVRAGQLSLAYLLIGHGANVQVTDSMGNTSLHVAVQKRALATVEALLQVGIEVDRKNNAGATALDLATADASTLIVERLLQNGARPVIGPTNELSRPDPQTRLRVQGQLEELPASTSEAPVLVRVQLKNVGNFGASEIKVRLKSSRRGYISLEGPASLSRNEVGNYTTPVANLMGELLAELRVEISCRNCRSH